MGRIVDWVRGLALTLGAPGLYLVAFLDSSFLSLPEINDLLVDLDGDAAQERMMLYVVAATLGSMAGCLVLYYVGRKGGEALIRKRFASASVDRAMAAFERYGVLAVLIPALLPPPAPFKIFVLLAGVAGISAGEFVDGHRHRPRGALPDARHPGDLVRRAGDGVHRGQRAAVALTVVGLLLAGLAGYLRLEQSAGAQKADKSRIIGRSPCVELSVVIPIRNEAAVARRAPPRADRDADGVGTALRSAHRRRRQHRRELRDPARLQARDPHLRVIRFRRNFGQTAAFSAGFDHARGRLIVTSDGDLQNDPRDIPAMVEMLERGHDIVCGWRKVRKDPFLSRRLPSMIANRLISMATGVHLHDYGCSLKVFRAEVVKPLRLYGEMHRFLPAIASEQGVSIAEVVGESPRAAARTLEVRHRPHDPRDPRSADGQVPPELLDAAAADLRADRASRWGCPGRRFWRGSRTCG